MSGGTELKSISSGDPLIVPGGSSLFLHAGEDVTIEVFKDATVIHKAEDVGAGWEIFDQEFTKAKISSATAQTVKIEYSDKRVRSNRLGGNVTTSNSQSSALTQHVETVGLTEVEVVAADASRKHVSLQASATNTNNIYIGGTGVTAANGHSIVPGESINFDNSSAICTVQIKAISDAAGQVLRVMEGD